MGTIAHLEHYLNWEGKETTQNDELRKSQTWVNNGKSKTLLATNYKLSKTLTMGSQTRKVISQVLICSPYLQLKPTWKITPTISK
jgi:hypothetical protein